MFCSSGVVREAAIVTVDVELGAFELCPQTKASWRVHARAQSTLPVHLHFGKFGLLVGCLTSQQHVSVSQGRVCSENFTCCYTEIEVADQTFHLTQQQYTDTGPTSPSTDPITPGAWQGRHCSANFQVTGMTRPLKKSRCKRDSNPGSSAFEEDALTTRPTRRYLGEGSEASCNFQYRTEHMARLQNSSAAAGPHMLTSV